MNQRQASPRVEIIILSWNGREDTLECLASLDKVEYDNFRVTVVDNGSTDGLEAAVRSGFPAVNYLYSPVNLRFAGGNNLALRMMSPGPVDYFLLLNNDTIVDPAFLQELVKVCETDNKIGLAGGKIYYYHQPDTIWFAGGKANIRRAYMRHLGIGKQDDGSFDYAGEVTFLNGACVLIRASVVEQIGLLDEDYYLYGEDLDYCLRAVKAGWKLYYQPAAQIWHKVSRSSPTLKKLYYRYWSWIILMNKHTAWYWRPLQIGNLALEFIPLIVDYLRRQAGFHRSDR